MANIEFGLCWAILRGIPFWEYMFFAIPSESECVCVCVLFLVEVFARRRWASPRHVLLPVAVRDAEL